MGEVGRNEPRPCGSGCKYKKCCLTNDGGAPYTGADRSAALQRLLVSIHPGDIDDASAKFWGKPLPLRGRWTDPALQERPPPAPFNLNGVRPLRGLVALVLGRELAGG